MFRIVKIHYIIMSKTANTNSRTRSKYGANAINAQKRSSSQKITQQ
jgi:hypothetical protein